MGDIIIWDNRFLSPHLRPQQRSGGGDDDVPHHPADELSALRHPDAAKWPR